jgi:hypothetical protein
VNSVVGHHERFNQAANIFSIQRNYWLMVRLGALDALRMHQQDPGLALTSASALHLRGELELDGEDLRREPLQVRKATLASALAKANAAICPTVRADQNAGSSSRTQQARRCCAFWTRRGKKGSRLPKAS